MPSFLTALITDKTSSEIRRFFATELPDANEENKTHLILKLLSPETNIFFLKGLIFFL